MRGDVVGGSGAVEIAVDEEAQVFAKGWVGAGVIDCVAHGGELRGLLLFVAFGEGDGGERGDEDSELGGGVFASS